jgi:hypothetical protein
MWKITLEGQPMSLRATIDGLASVEHNRHFVDNDLTIPMYYATAVPLLQTVPRTVGAAPGILYPDVFTKWAPDFRDIESPAFHNV